MNFNLSTHVLIAHWVPGFLVAITLRAVLLIGAPTTPILKSLMGSDTSGSALEVLVVVVTAFFIGEVLDASRDLLENAWDLLQPMNWDFFVTAGKDKVENFRTSYFTYYAFDCNVSLALIIMLLLAYFSSAPTRVLLILVVPLAIFVLNGWRLRTEMAPLTRG